MTQTSEAEIDAYLESILKAAGSSLRHYESYSKDAMRKAMRDALYASPTPSQVQEVTELMVERAWSAFAGGAGAFPHQLAAMKLALESSIGGVK